MEAWEEKLEINVGEQECKQEEIEANGDRIVWRNGVSGFADD